MENNEIMNFEEVEFVNDEVAVEERHGVGTGAAMLIGAGLALAVSAGVKLGKKVAAKIRAKRALHKPDHEILVEDEDIEEIAAK